MRYTHEVSVIPADSKLRLAFLDGDEVLFAVSMTLSAAENMATELRNAVAALKPSTLRVVK